MAFCSHEELLEWSQLWSEKVCQSPIERKFIDAYLEVVWADDSNFQSQQHPQHFKSYLAHPKLIPYQIYHHMRTDIIFPQCQIDKYRVDFVLGRMAYGVEFHGDEPGDEVLVKSPPLIVECDGHDFHERTKEQAAKDRSRDRDLTLMGHRVIRFTGSEIHRDAMGCARQADDIIKSFLIALARQPI